MELSGCISVLLPENWLVPKKTLQRVWAKSYGKVKPSCLGRWVERALGSHVVRGRCSHRPQGWATFPNPTLGTVPPHPFSSENSYCWTLSSDQFSKKTLTSACPECARANGHPPLAGRSPSTVLEFHALDMDPHILCVFISEQLPTMENIYDQLNLKVQLMYELLSFQY